MQSILHADNLMWLPDRNAAIVPHMMHLQELGDSNIIEIWKFEAGCLHRLWLQSQKLEASSCLSLEIVVAHRSSYARIWLAVNKSTHLLICNNSHCCALSIWGTSNTCAGILPCISIWCDCQVPSVRPWWIIQWTALQKALLRAGTWYAFQLLLDTSWKDHQDLSRLDLLWEHWCKLHGSRRQLICMFLTVWMMIMIESWV